MRLSSLILIAYNLHQTEGHTCAFGVADARINGLSDATYFIDHLAATVVVLASHNIPKSLHETAIQ